MVMGGLAVFQVLTCSTYFIATVLLPGISLHVILSTAICITALGWGLTGQGLKVWVTTGFGFLKRVGGRGVKAGAVAICFVLVLLYM
jgi:hypothetical protein